MPLSSSLLTIVLYLHYCSEFSPFKLFLKNFFQLLNNLLRVVYGADFANDADFYLARVGHVGLYLIGDVKR